MMQVDSAQLSHATTIDGLAFEPNITVPLDDAHGWFSHKLSSSPGPLISDFVTHEAGFTYGTYGIHVGQDDRLTFMGDGPRIVGHFVDCRSDSPTAGVSVSLEFDPSIARKLIIPRGVAHTFDRLAGIVTRDEPIWYTDQGNPSWNIDNDLISVSRGTEPACFPRISPNRFRLPTEAHLLMSQLSQALLERPATYLNRVPIRLKGELRYLLVEPRSWATEDPILEARLRFATPITGVHLARNRYALTGKASWTVVPSSEACLSDVLVLEPARGRDDVLHLHARTRKSYTFLNAEGTPIELDLLDLRLGSASEGRRFHAELTADPRIRLVIPHGVAYRLRAPARLLVRCEQTIFVDADDEPRPDLPPFGADLTRLSGQAAATYRLRAPAIECPGRLIHHLATAEASASSTPR